MSMATWAIKGIGIRLSSIIGMLDAELLIPHIDGFERDEEFDAASNEERMEMLDYLRFDETDFLCSVLQRADESGILITSNDGEDEYYLLYSRHYPWEKSGFANADEAKEHIVSLVHNFCRPESGATREVILDLIEELDEIGER